MFSPVATETDRCKLGSSEGSGGNEHSSDAFSGQLRHAKPQTPPTPILPAVTLLRPQSRSISTPLSLPGWTGAARNTGRARAPGAMSGVTHTASVGVAERQTAPPPDGLTLFLPLHLQMNHEANSTARDLGHTEKGADWNADVLAAAAAWLLPSVARTW